MKSRLGRRSLVAAAMVGLVLLLSLGLGSTAALAQRGGRGGGSSHGGRSFPSGRSFSSGAMRGFSGTRHSPRAQPFNRGWTSTPRRVVPGFHSVPSYRLYGYYVPYSYAYPFYGYAPYVYSYAYPYPSCGFYDQWGYWHADSYCGSYPYYPYPY